MRVLGEDEGGVPARRGLASAILDRGAPIGGGQPRIPPATAVSYSAENWLLADGDEREVAKATSVFRCDTLGCIGQVKGKTVALIRHPGALEDDCRIADIVIAPFTIGKKCRAARVLVDRRMLKAHGAYALYVESLSIRTETVAAARGRRPWTPERAIVTARPAAYPQWEAGGKEGGAARSPRSDGNPKD
jgi:competence protein ComEC